jgi:hypothetical protein
MTALQKDLELVLSDIDTIAELCKTAMQETNQNIKNTSDYDYKDNKIEFLMGSLGDVRFDLDAIIDKIKELKNFVEDTIDSVEYNEIAKQAIRI